jgi:hypothetical protein
VKKVLLAVLIMLTVVSCQTYQNNDGTTNYNAIGYDAASVYLVTKKKVVKEKDRKAIAKGYAIVHTALDEIPQEGIPSLREYLKSLLIKHIENEDDRAIALLFFNKACNEIRLKIDLSKVKGSALVKIARQIDTGIQQALIEYKFLRE